ncbi:hypothetical protein [Chlamydiifrater volucris]|uniref:hypothetical protein n=1 Tax=Chlamydiifrater volucris TaxID=2681470 RepID=UPI001BCE0EC9|nr:hypothetical protein [Chlamydiifrater volucris]
MTFVRNESNLSLNFENTESLFNEGVANKGRPFSRSLLSVTLLALGAIVMVSGVIALILSSPAIPITASVILGITSISFGSILLTISVMVLASSKLFEHFNKKKEEVAELLDKISFLECSECELESALRTAKENETSLMLTLQTKEEFISELESGISSSRERIKGIQDQFDLMRSENHELANKLKISEKVLKEKEEKFLQENLVLTQCNRDLEALNKRIRQELERQVILLAELKNKEFELEEQLLINKKSTLEAFNADKELLNLGSKLVDLFRENHRLKDRLKLFDGSLDCKNLSQLPTSFGKGSSTTSPLPVPSFVMSGASVETRGFLSEPDNARVPNISENYNEKGYKEESSYQQDEEEQGEQEESLQEDDKTDS